MKMTYGANYYPLVTDRNDWKKDLETYKSAGINYIRTAEIVHGWDYLEPTPGVYLFDELEEFFDLAATMDIKILLGSGLACSPAWLSEKDPTVNILSSSGRRFPNHATYGWACYNNPTFKKYAKRFLTALVNHFKDHKALMGYQINNEIGYPFMPLAQGSELEMYCYCEHCQKGFQDYTLNKYGNFKSIQKAWTWSTSNSHINKKEDIAPPMVKPSAWSSVTRYLDWRLYHMNVITSEVKWENDIIKSLDDIHPTVLNTFFMKSQDPLAVATALDQFEVAKVPDYIGYDLYPGSGKKLETKPEFSSMFLDHARSVVRPLGKEFWLSEVEGGPIGGWVMGPRNSTNSTDIIRNQLEGIGHGSKSFLYQLLKELDFQPLHWGGAVALDGTPTEAFRGVKAIGKLIQDNLKFLSDAKVMKSKVAILVDKENHILLDGFDQGKDFLEELRGTYKYYWSKGHQVDFINSEHLINGYAKNFDIIHAPLMAWLADETANAIKDYVSSGKTFIASARFGYLNKIGWYQRVMPNPALVDITGFKMVDCHVKKEIPIIDGKNIAYGSHHQETIEIDEDVDVIAKFENNTPAVTVKRTNGGKFVYIATQFGLANLKNSKISTIIDKVIDLKPLSTIKQSRFDEKVADAHLLVNEDKAWVIVTNYLNTNQQKELSGTLELKIQINTEQKYNNAKDVLTGTTIDIGDNTINIACNMDGGNIIEIW